MLVIARGVADAVRQRVVSDRIHHGLGKAPVHISRHIAVVSVRHISAEAHIIDAAVQVLYCPDPRIKANGRDIVGSVMHIGRERKELIPVCGHSIHTCR